MFFELALVGHVDPHIPLVCARATFRCLYMNLLQLKIGSKFKCQATGALRVFGSPTYGPNRVADANVSTMRGGVGDGGHRDPRCGWNTSGRGAMCTHCLPIKGESEPDIHGLPKSTKGACRIHGALSFKLGVIQSLCDHFNPAGGPPTQLADLPVTLGPKPPGQGDSHTNG